jgi:DNA-binding NarL/FixJ family response regulator
VYQEASSEVGGVGAEQFHRSIAKIAKSDGHIALIESRAFVRGCMHNSMQSAFSLPVVAYAALSELESHFSESVALILLSVVDARQTECVTALKALTALNGSIPIVVLGTANDVESAKSAINNGAKGYIPCTTNFEIAIRAVHFVLEGGTYAPIDMLAADRSDSPAITARALADVLTAREIRIVRAIQEGKSNKVIAYEVCICEGTVKVHIRNIMRKMKAKNRTDVAIKAQDARSMSA